MIQLFDKGHNSCFMGLDDALSMQTIQLLLPIMNMNATWHQSLVTSRKQVFQVDGLAHKYILFLLHNIIII